MNACVWMTSDFLYPLTRGNNVKSLCLIRLRLRSVIDLFAISGNCRCEWNSRIWGLLWWRLLLSNSLPVLRALPRELPITVQSLLLDKPEQGLPGRTWGCPEHFEEVDNAQCPTSLSSGLGTTVTYPFLWSNATSWTGLTSVLGSLVRVVRCSVKLPCTTVRQRINGKS